MKIRTVSTLLFGSLAAVASAAPGDLIYRADFSDAAAWGKPKEYGGPFKYEFKGDSFGITGTRTNLVDTAFQITGPRQTLGNFGGMYAICCEFSSKGIHKDFVGATGGYTTAVVWFDARGNEVERNPMGFVFADRAPFDYRFVYQIPPAAKSFEIRLGWDSPNLSTDTSCLFRNLRLVVANPDESVSATRPDVSGPRIRIASESPTRRDREPVVVRVTDESGVDRASIAVKADGRDVANYDAKPVDKGFDLVLPPPDGKWKEGLHRLDVTAKDGEGCQTAAKKFFLIGDVPATPKISIRDDGVTLIGCEPFFPIGVYGVCKRDFNAYCWERAVSDLHDAGFNLLHSYGAPRDPEFHRCAAKYGMKMWMAAYEPDAAIVEKFRHGTNVIAWYLGDDTSMNTTANELWDRADNIRAVDPTRLTTQADVLAANYGNYAPQTDNFLPEIYPVHGYDQKADRMCVASTIEQMKAIRRTQALDGTPHNVWPIIQYFKGWGWKRFPTPEEFYAMSFASIIHGAKGITWYTYGGFVNVEKKKFNFGVTSSEQVWATTTNCTRRLARLAPVLLERDPAQPAIPEVVEGPTNDGKGGPSVTMLLKEKDGVKYLFAVNSADAVVKAKMAPKAAEKVEVMWENRSVAAAPDGSIVDVFKPLAVHVYRWK